MGAASNKAGDHDAQQIVGCVEHSDTHAEQFNQNLDSGVRRNDEFAGARSTPYGLDGVYPE